MLLYLNEQDVLAVGIDWKKLICVILLCMCYKSTEAT